jgi:hypothetical protein
MDKTRWISRLFVVAAFYDGILGLLFLVAAGQVFDWFGVTPPNHFAYVQFPAALLIVFALMFLVIAWNPVQNRNLIPYGILLKVSYCSIAFYHWFSAGIPGMWKPFALFDLIFMILFGWAYLTLGDFRELKENAD